MLTTAGRTFATSVAMSGVPGEDRRASRRAPGPGRGRPERTRRQVLAAGPREEEGGTSERNELSQGHGSAYNTGGEGIPGCPTTSLLRARPPSVLVRRVDHVPEPRLLVGRRFPLRLHGGRFRLELGETPALRPRPPRSRRPRRAPRAPGRAASGRGRCPPPPATRGQHSSVTGFLPRRPLEHLAQHGEAAPSSAAAAHLEGRRARAPRGKSEEQRGEDERHDPQSDGRAGVHHL